MPLLGAKKGVTTSFWDFILLLFSNFCEIHKKKKNVLIHWILYVDSYKKTKFESLESFLLKKDKMMMSHGAF